MPVETFSIIHNQLIMPANQDTLFRQWHMLRYVPRYPQKITVQAIHSYLANDGFEVSQRTVQRDLVDLSKVFPLVSDEREKPFGWSWQRDARSFDLPGLSVAEALTWVLAEQHLKQLLPVSMLDNLSPYFRAAHDRLDKEPQPHRGRNWLNKVRTVQPNQPLLPPNIDPEVQRAVSEALLHEKKIEICYRRKAETETVTYQVHPLALVQRGSVVYLYGRLFDYPDTRTLAMHRIESVVLLEQPAIPPEGFDIDDKVAKGVWSFGGEESVAVRLKFFDGKGNHLLETPLSADQQTEASSEDPGMLIVNATVVDSPQLRWWLLGFGDGVEVLAPKSLRQEMANAATRALGRYAEK